VVGFDVFLLLRPKSNTILVSGAALHSLRRYDEAISSYESGLAIAPSDAGLKSGLAEVQKAKESHSSAGFDNGGGLFGPQMIAKLAGHPKFGPKLSDPTFMMKLQMAQKNPQMMMSDPEMMEVLQAILGSFGGGGGDDDIPAPASNTTHKRKETQKTEPEPEVEVSEEEKLERAPSRLG
jgi:stress-induced-phosphoprotein 1